MCVCVCVCAVCVCVRVLCRVCGADQSLRIGYGELQLGKVLGKGFFGEVRQGTWRGSDVAVKVIYRREFRNSDQIQLFEKEIRVLR